MKLIINPDVEIKFKDNSFYATIKEEEAYALTPIAYFICKNADGKHTVEDLVVGLESEFKEHSIGIPENLDLAEEIKRVTNLLSTKGIVFIE